MEKGTIIYFGTTCKGSGHGATLLKGSFDSRDEMSEFERWIDGLTDRQDLQKFWPTRGTFATITFDRGTWFGVNLSPHDERGGSKTVLYVEGLHLRRRSFGAAFGLAQDDNLDAASHSLHKSLILPSKDAAPCGM